VVKAEIRTFVGNRIDTTCWPLVLWESLPDRATDAEVAGALDYLVEILRLTPPETKTFSLSDISLVTEPPPPNQRRMIAGFIANNETLLRRTIAGGAIVAPSPLVRGAVTAIYWVRPSPVPTTVFATREEALAQGIQVLERTNGKLPPSLQALRPQGTKAPVP
jgi:hypothetical protein